MKQLSIILLSLFICSCKQKDTLFIDKTAAETGIQFTNQIIENDSLNFFNYQYIYNGAGVAVGDLDNDGWDDIFFVSNQQGGNKLYKNNGAFKFSDVTNTAGVQGLSQWSTGVTMVDINADGWLDIYVSTVTIPGILQSHNELYINNKNGTFTESAAQYGLDFKGHCTQAAFFDYDNDGDLDCFLLNHSAEYAGDYKTTLVRKVIDPLSGEKLLQNNHGRFSDVTAKAGLIGSSLSYGLGVVVGDINNDGWMDIYMSNDFKENDYCYMNNGDGTFTEQSGKMFGHTSRFSMGSDMADINNDGWPEIISSDMLSPNEKILKSSVADDDIDTYNFKQQYGFNDQYSRNCLQYNMDGKYFSDEALQKGVAATDWSWAPLFADFDNDGNKDLFISNGFKYRSNDLDFNIFAQQTAATMNEEKKKLDKQYLIKKMPAGNVADYFYLQSSNGFTDKSKAAGFTKPTLSNGSAYADLDKDGRLDLIINRLQEPAGIYKNNMPTQNYCSIILKGQDGNTQGIGAMVYVYTKGIMQVYQQSLSRGFMSSVSPVMHVGLGDAGIIDSLKIIWPGGKGQMLTNIHVNINVVLEQQNVSPDFSKPVLKKTIDDSWINSTDAEKINFIHREDTFDDLNINPLLPHSLATQGPATAVADVNNDGLQDFFVCGAKGQPGQLWLQTNQATFIKSKQHCFLVDSMCEETNALFFDADGDKDMDLYVVSGGNEFYGNSALLTDRLYINDGKGNFSRSTTLPDVLENKSCVAACDFDKDGDMDLFVGGRVNARMYGYNPASVLLVNDGRGNFTEATGYYSTGLQYAGMVTSACWSDIDGDGWQDLIIAGEWMPITVFKNNKGHLEKQEQQGLLQSNGWWNCMYKTDLDGDGDDDFLLGNWGNNSKLKASAQHPLLMYLADWDNNGDMDPLLCIYKNDNYYNFLGKADLEKRLPFLRKKYLQYSAIAGKTVQNLFTTDALDKAKKFSAYTLQSSIMWNNKGQLSLQTLPDFLQVSPIFCFSMLEKSNGGQNYLAAGNFYDVQPYEGRYDAMLPVVFSIDMNKNVNKKGCLLEKGALRSIQPIKLNKNKQGLLLAKNNERLILLSKNKN